MKATGEELKKEWLECNFGYVLNKSTLQATNHNPYLIGKVSVLITYGNRLTLWNWIRPHSTCALANANWLANSHRVVNYYQRQTGWSKSRILNCDQRYRACNYKFPGTAMRISFMLLLTKIAKSPCRLHQSRKWKHGHVNPMRIKTGVLPIKR